MVCFLYYIKPVPVKASREYYDECVIELSSAFRETRLGRMRPDLELVGFVDSNFEHYIPGKYSVLKQEFSKIKASARCREAKRDLLLQLYDGETESSKRALLRENYRLKAADKMKGRRAQREAMMKQKQHRPIPQKAPRSTYEVEPVISEADWAALEAERLQAGESQFVENEHF